jgi:ABC-type uncharacterized transport system permease subunit
VPDIVIHAVACAAYVGLAWHFWNTRWRRQASGGLRGWERGAVLAALAVHGWLLYDGLFAARELRFGFAQALSVMTWLAVLVYWIESFFYRLDGMEPLVLLAAAATVPLPAFFPGLASSGAHAQAMEFRLHLALAMSAYGLFLIAVLHATLMLVVERGLHQRKAFFRNLPPLLTLEQLLFRTVAAAFVLLTLTLLTGIAFSETLFGRALRSDHKTVFAVLSWLTFGWLLAGRWLYGWRGRTAVRWTLGGFVLLVLAYVGSRFVLEVLLQRA